ncbi:hypothetical protein F511_22541 [Dorcoceras hygrometricum]|uniref:Uncharacterized protein n=1 Tax=Dorcoceras hygrometricum TaxID=472368 RepID=A0A2Z7BV69_9LAMI|nr:hypothetical protein F511_22541 [Dorcoceras hygrometricum]
MFIRRKSADEIISRSAGEFFQDGYSEIQQMATEESAEIYSGLFTSRWHLMLAVVKRYRLDKWIRQRFAFALKFSR